MVALSLACVAVVAVARRAPGAGAPPLRRIDDVFYDGFYRLRPTEDQAGGPVVIVAADDYSLARLLAEKHLGWPWPRDQWAAVLQYARRGGAKAVVFDVLFEEPSVFDRDLADDQALADAVDAAEVPVVVFARRGDAGGPGRFALPLRGRPRWGEVKMRPADVLREYDTSVLGRPGLAAATLAAIGRGDDVARGGPFLLHYYGPHVKPGGGHTFRYVSAADVVDAFLGDAAAAAKVGKDTFKDKIVVVGATAAGTYDLKVTPLSPIYPGAEVQATAIANLLRRQRVEPVGSGWAALAMIGFPMLTVVGAGIPRSVPVKIALAAAGIAGPVVLAALLFTGSTIRWLPPAGPLVAGVLGAVAALAWSYFIEDRHRRFFLRALEQYVSPAVAEELSRDRGKLKIGSERREMTVMFTDIANFSDLSERLEPEQLGELLNFYLNEMSGVILSADGTLDKYLGDGIMTFWNAPLPQPDHARRACGAALAMLRREGELADRLRELGGPGLYTRIGINTGPMAVGNLGSSRKFDYSVLGDAVNLASRLEGANKIYGTRILVSQSTAERVKDHFFLRKIDVLRVKGKARPIAIYEPMGDGPGTAAQVELAALYEHALARYEAGDWDGADRQLHEIFQKFPSDGPSLALSKRVSGYRQHPPPPDWDGVFVASEK